MYLLQREHVYRAIAQQRQSLSAPLFQPVGGGHTESRMSS
jgi:hypothetical protein